MIFVVSFASKKRMLIFKKKQNEQSLEFDISSNTQYVKYKVINFAFSEIFIVLFK